MRAYSLIAVYVIVFLLSLAGGCSKPYRTASVTPEDASFPGILHYVDNEPSPRLIAIHGMCHHDDAWVHATANRMKQFLGMTGKQAQIVIPGSADSNSPSAELWHTSLANDNSEKLEFYAIVYSGLTQEHKQSLCSNVSRKTCVCTAIDNEGAGQYRRRQASINAQVKNRLLNECLSDAVIYAGEKGDSIRRGIRDALLTAMAGMTTQPPDTMSMLTQIKPQQAPILFLSESLGSKILFDVVVGLQNDLYQTSMYKGFTELISNVNYIHMGANQIPIMRLAYDPHLRHFASLKPSDEYMSMSQDSRMSGINEMVEIIQNARKITQGDDTHLQRVQVIAYTDPNDVLSYELVKESGESATSDTNQVSVEEIRTDERLSYVDITVSNASTVLGLVANPLKAHLGYLDNNEVAGRIIEGSNFDGEDYIGRLNDTGSATCQALRDDD